MVAVITWLWGNKYGVQDVNRLVRGVRKHSKTINRFVLFTDQVERMAGLDSDVEQNRSPDLDLCGRGCFCRLRMFDPGWQAEHGFTDRIISLDLDAIIVGPIDDLFEKHWPFMILQGANAANPNPFNASVMMLRPRTRPDVWSDFSLARAEATPFYEFPDDQGWIWHKIPHAPGWPVGSPSGIYGFEKPGWPAYGSQRLPEDARIVAFIGKRKPAQYTHVPWVKKHWESAA
jgi:hypothetical protein